MISNCAVFAKHEDKLGVVVIYTFEGWVLPNSYKYSDYPDYKYTAWKALTEEMELNITQDKLKNMTLQGERCSNLFYSDGFVDMNQCVKAYKKRNLKAALSDALGIVYMDQIVDAIQSSSPLKVTEVCREQSLLKFLRGSSQTISRLAVQAILELHTQISNKTLGILEEIPLQKSHQDL